MSTPLDQAKQLLADLPDLLTVDVIASRLRVSSETVKRWIRAADNPLPAMKSPGRYLVVKDELAQWMSRHQDDPSSPSDGASGADEAPADGAGVAGGD